MALAWPVVGREGDLKSIARAIDRREAGIVLLGGPGVGKSSLARVAVAQASGRGAATAWAVGTRSAASIPFGTLAHLLPDEFPPSPSLANLLAAAATALRPKGESDPFVLAVDDAHAVDATSAALLHHLALSGGAFLLLTMRPGVPAPDSITALVARLPTHVQVTELGRDEIAPLLEAVLGSQVDSATVQRLWRLTNGNPLFLRETVQGGLAEGELQEVRGVWRWQGGLPAAPDVEAAVRARLAALPGDEQAALEILATGEPLDLAVLERLVDGAALQALDRGHLLISRHDGKRVTTTLSHPLYGQAVGATLSALRSRDIYRRLAEALEAAGGRRREDLLQLAVWRLEAGDATRPETSLPAAARALALFDYPLAERLANAAASVGFEATAIAVTATIAQGRFEEAEILLRRLQQESITDDQRGRAAMDRAANVATNLGRLDAALEILGRAEAELRESRPRDLVAAMRAWLLFCAGRLPEALESGRRLVKSDLPEAAIPFGVGAAIQTLIYRGQTGEALELIDDWDERVRVGIRGTFYEALGFTLSRALALIFEGRLDEAAAVVRPAYEGLLDSGTTWVRALWAGLLGIIARLRGDVAASVRWLREGVALLTDANTTGQLPALLGELAQSLALLGDAEGAMEAVGQAEALRTWQRFDDGYLAAGHVWATVARGETRAAIELALARADTLAALELHPQRAMVLHDVARLGEPGRVVEPLRMVAEVCDGDLVATLARHAAALALGNADLLEQVSADFERMGTLLLSAEAAAEASRAHRNDGRQASAARMASRAGALMKRCNGPTTPALRGLGRELPISPRELEIATLASRGRTNRDIAGHLTLSVRTVDNHLHNVYQKLGIASRDELVQILEPFGAVAHERPPDLD